MRRVSLYVLPFAALMAVLLVQGCVITSASYLETDPVAAQERSPLLYYAWLRQAKAEELSAERRRLDTNSAGEDAFMRALRQGLLMLASGVADGGREAAVLEALGSESAELQLEENRALASLVSTQLRLRRQVNGSSRQSANTTAEMERLRSENTRLQQQIDALTSIEQQLIERELQDAPNKGQP
jgi:cell division protein FtsB